MSIQSLKRDLTRTRQDWDKWVELWEIFWFLPMKFAEAKVEPIISEVAQVRADNILKTMLDEGEISPEQASNFLVRTLLERDEAAKLRAEIRGGFEFDEERQQALPQLVKKLQEASGGNYRRLKDGLDKAYEFRLPTASDSPVAPLEYPDEIYDVVKETLELFSTVQREVMQKLHTLEYFTQKLERLKEEMTGNDA